jgi:hypothetical protein
MMPHLLAAVAPGALETASLGGGSWWRVMGGLAVVFGLLFLCLKLLTRYGKRTGAAQARLLTVWHLGPRREIQVLRLGDAVSYVYRHENAMVMLKQETWDEYRRQYGDAATGPVPGATIPPAFARLFNPLTARLNRPGA